MGVFERLKSKNNFSRAKLGNLYIIGLSGVSGKNLNLPKALLFRDYRPLAALPYKKRPLNFHFLFLFRKFLS